MNNKLINNSDNWIQFAQNYLYMARLSCQELLSENNDKHSKAPTNMQSDFSSIKYDYSDLFIPIIFNTKHGIEVFIKTLKIILRDKLSKNDESHNISNLFKILRSEINNKKIVELIRKKYEENPSDTDVEFAYNQKLKIPKFLNDLEKLIMKFYHCEVLQKKLNNNFIIEDVSNTAFRYPDNNLKININYDSILVTVSKEDVKSTLEDIEKLLWNFNELGFILEVYKKHEKK